MYSLQLHLANYGWRGLLESRSGLSAKTSLIRTKNLLKHFSMLRFHHHVYLAHCSAESATYTTRNVISSVSLSRRRLESINRDGSALTISQGKPREVRLILHHSYIKMMSLAERYLNRSGNARQGACHGSKMLLVKRSKNKLMIQKHCKIWSLKILISFPKISKKPMLKWSSWKVNCWPPVNYSPRLSCLPTTAALLNMRTLVESHPVLSWMISFSKKHSYLTSRRITTREFCRSQTLFPSALCRRPRPRFRFRRLRRLRKKREKRSYERELVDTGLVRLSMPNTLSLDSHGYHAVRSGAHGVAQQLRGNFQEKIIQERIGSAATQAMFQSLCSSLLQQAAPDVAPLPELPTDRRALGRSTGEFRRRGSRGRMLRGRRWTPDSREDNKTRGVPRSNRTDSRRQRQNSTKHTLELFRTVRRWETPFFCLIYPPWQQQQRLWWIPSEARLCQTALIAGQLHGRQLMVRSLSCQQAEGTCLRDERPNAAVWESYWWSRLNKQSGRICKPRILWRPGDSGREWRRVFFSRTEQADYHCCKSRWQILCSNFYKALYGSLRKREIFSSHISFQVYRERVPVNQQSRDDARTKPVTPNSSLICSFSRCRIILSLTGPCQCRGSECAAGPGTDLDCACRFPPIVLMHIHIIGYVSWRLKSRIGFEDGQNECPLDRRRKSRHTYYCTPSIPRASFKGKFAGLLIDSGTLMTFRYFAAATIYWYLGPSKKIPRSRLRVGGGCGSFNNDRCVLLRSSHSFIRTTAAGVFPREKKVCNNAERERTKQLRM
eukprot:284816803_5